MPLPLLVPAYYLCHYYYHYYYYFYCCTCSTIPKNPELATDKPPTLHCRGTLLFFSWIWLVKVIDWTWWSKEGIGLSMRLKVTKLALRLTPRRDQQSCVLISHICCETFQQLRFLMVFFPMYIFNPHTDNCGLLRTNYLKSLVNCCHLDNGHFGLWYSPRMGFWWILHHIPSWMLHELSQKPKLLFGRTILDSFYLNWRWTFTISLLPVDCEYCESNASQSKLNSNVILERKKTKQFLDLCHHGCIWSPPQCTHCSCGSPPWLLKDSCHSAWGRLLWLNESQSSVPPVNIWTCGACQPALRFPSKHLSLLWLDLCCLDSVHAVVIGPYPNQ